MTTRTRRSGRFAIVVAAGLGVGVLGACGGGGGAGDAQTPAAPAAAIDPSSNNAITGPVNRARAVAADQEEHDRQLEQQGSGGQP